VSQDPLDPQDLQALQDRLGLLDYGAERATQDPLDSPHKQVRLDPLDQRVQPAGSDPLDKLPPREQRVLEEILAARGPLEAQVLGVSQAFVGLQEQRGLQGQQVLLQRVQGVHRVLEGQAALLQGQQASLGMEGYLGLPHLRE
jgi:hypothetical protein